MLGFQKKNFLNIIHRSKGKNNNFKEIFYWTIFTKDIMFFPHMPYLTPNVPWLCFSKITQKLPPWSPKKDHAKKIFLKNFNCRIWLNISMEICGIFLRNFCYIDFEIIAFEGRRQCFFRPSPAGSTTFDSHFHHFIKVHKAELLEIHSMWHVRYLWKKS